MFTSTNDFRVKQTIGSSWNVDEDDVVKTKTALKSTGDYKAPEWGVTGYPDQSMFDGLKSFQKREGLQADGVMKPGGRKRGPARNQRRPDEAQVAMMPTTVPGLGNVGIVGARRSPAERGEAGGGGGALLLGAAAAKLLMDRQRQLGESGSGAPKVEDWDKDQSNRVAIDPPPPTPGFEPPDIPEGMTPPSEAGILDWLANILHFKDEAQSDDRPEDECDKQLRKDLAVCGIIANGDRQIFRRCEKSAMERYANCIAGRENGPLDEGY